MRFFQTIMRFWLATLAITIIKASPSIAQQNAAPSTPPPTPVGLMYRPNHTALRVADLETSVSWWKNVFGAEEVRRSEVPNISPGAEIVFLHIADGFHIELIGGGEPEILPSPVDIGADYGVSGYKHVGFMVADMDLVVQHLNSQGVEVEYTVDRPDYGVRIVLIREPSGHYVELYAPLEQ